MNIVILTFLCISFLNICNSSLNNNGIIIKNKFLKILLLSDKKNIVVFKQIKNFYKICYNKSIDTIIQGVSGYNNLSEDEKTIIEVIISLCY